MKIIVSILMVAFALMVGGRRYPDDESVTERIKDYEDDLQHANLTDASDDEEELKCKDAADVIVAMRDVFKLVAIILGILILACIIACSVRRSNCCNTISPEATPDPVGTGTLKKGKSATLKKDKNAPSQSVAANSAFDSTSSVSRKEDADEFSVGDTLGDDRDSLGAEATTV